MVTDVTTPLILKFIHGGAVRCIDLVLKELIDERFFAAKLSQTMHALGDCCCWERRTIGFAVRLALFMLLQVVVLCASKCG